MLNWLLLAIKRTQFNQWKCWLEQNQIEYSKQKHSSDLEVQLASQLQAKGVSKNQEKNSYWLFLLKKLEHSKEQFTVMTSSYKLWRHHMNITIELSEGEQKQRPRLENNDSESSMI